MRLELGLHHIKDVRFATRTEIDSDVLSISRSELAAHLAQEPLFERVEIELTHPGESCRILRVLDVVEPRYRLNGFNFPGALDPNGLVGEGETRALKNVAVVETDQCATQSRSIIDMNGPAAAYSPLCNTHNIVLVAHPKPGADKDDYRLAMKKAGLKTAAYLAASAQNVTPSERQSFELPPVAANQGPKHLPRIAYIFPMHSHQHPTQQSEPVFYGSNIQGFMGNCGLTLAPCKPETRDALIGTFVRVEDMPRQSLQAGIPWAWTTHDEFLDALERQPLGLNVATLVGHCAVRQYAMGEASVEREANDAEIAEMEELVRQGMAAGAFGFSTNANQRHFREDGKPVPSRFAALDEVARLCRAVGESRRGLVQFTHGAFASPEHVAHIGNWYDTILKETRRPLIGESIRHFWSEPDLWRKQLSDVEARCRQGHGDQSLGVRPARHEDHIFVRIEVKVLRENNSGKMSRRAETTDADPLVLQLLQSRDSWTSKNRRIIVTLDTGDQHQIEARQPSLDDLADAH